MGQANGMQALHAQRGEQGGLLLQPSAHKAGLGG